MAGFSAMCVEMIGESRLQPAKVLTLLHNLDRTASAVFPCSQQHRYELEAYATFTYGVT